MQFKIAAIIRIQIPNSNTFILRGVYLIFRTKNFTQDLILILIKKKVSFDKLQIIIIYSQWKMERNLIHFKNVQTNSDNRTEESAKFLYILMLCEKKQQQQHFILEMDLENEMNDFTFFYLLTRFEFFFCVEKSIFTFFFEFRIIIHLFG